LATKEIIYVALLNEGTDVWRPTTGEKIGDDVFKILATPDYDPDDEQWEFLPDTIVKCKIEVKNIAGKNQTILIANERV
jgi:hypothetical protein